MLSRADYAKRLFVSDKINLDEFERRITLLVEAGKGEDPYIVDAGPAGFRDP